MRDEENNATTTPEQCEQSNEASTSCGINVLDPDRVVTKGRDNKREKGHYDLYKKNLMEKKGTKNLDL